MTLVKKPVASIELIKENIQVDPLAAFIEGRQTNRRKYKGNLISQEEFNALASLTGKSHSKLVFINSEFEPYLDIFTVVSKSNQGLSIQMKKPETSLGLMKSNGLRKEMVSAFLKWVIKA